MLCLVEIGSVVLQKSFTDGPDQKSFQLKWQKLHGATSDVIIASISYSIGLWYRRLIYKSLQAEVYF